MAGGGKKTDSDKDTCLVIVESPAKERTISRFLSGTAGKGKFLVRSSYGHVRDLPPKRLGVAVDDGFSPEYVVLPRSKKILAELKPLAEKSPNIYLATDHDREGESIAWHLIEMLKLPEGKVCRITFHEITPEAISEALSSPRKIDYNLVHAQQARRVIDRLVGYKLSPLLWEKIQSGLSAGRVQSVAVRLLVERAGEIEKFSQEEYWSLAAVLEKDADSPPFEARLVSWKGKKIEETMTFDLFAEPYKVKVTSLKGRSDLLEVEAAAFCGRFRVASVEKKEARRGPPPPFLTSTLQQAASQRLRFDAERTMRVAQSLYEGVDLGGEDSVGLITYMRTDSLSVAKASASQAAEFIRTSFGAEYVPVEPPTYQTKAPRAQEAHEAIRPTSVLRGPDDVRRFLSPDQAKLYRLVWERFVASQMRDAVYDTVSADIECRPGEGVLRSPGAGALKEDAQAPGEGAGSGLAVFRATGRTLKFDGFLKVAKPSDTAAAEEEPEEGGACLPPLAEGEALKLAEIKPREHKTLPPPNYNEASLIRAMEKHGIGRPSTYAPTIKTVINRGYVRRSKDRKLNPSDLGKLVTEALRKHFPDVVSLSYTAKVEERLDAVAEGVEPWTSVVDDFYSPFAKALKDASDLMQVVRAQPKESDQKCPVCRTVMLIRESRFGKYLSCSRFPKCKGKISLDSEGRAVVPEKTGERCDSCGKEMVIRMGRKGRFLACSGYPQCKNTYSLDADGKKIEGSRPVATSRKCNKCGSFMWLRLGKRGHFLACSAFPKCRNIKPVTKDDAAALRQEAEALKNLPHGNPPAQRG
ncbi:MAG: type I DNA topoisomerase [Elusimicrobia bacterium]|nr:type I DNA topoisomerase [Elusimicrobiota bacterium]